MNRFALPTALVLLALAVAPCGAVDLAHVDRKIAKEPVYHSRPSTACSPLVAMRSAASGLSMTAERSISTAMATAT